MDETYDVVVVGAGIAGLTAAATAAGAGCSVLVLDGQPAGGRASTDQHGRFRFNRGGHALYRTTPGREVLRRLKVHVSGHLPPTKGAQGRLGDRIGLLPYGPGSLARTNLFTVREKVVVARMLQGMGGWRPDQLAGVTVTEWLDDMGVQGAPRQMIEMLVRTTSFVADVDVVSADLVVSQIQAGLQGNVEYLDGGWSTLTDGLSDAVRRAGGQIDTGQQARSVIPDGGRVRVAVNDREVLGRRAILAAGTPEADAALVPERPAAWESLGPPIRVACRQLGLAGVPEVAVLLGLDRPLYLSRHAPPGHLAPDGASMYETVRYLRTDEDPSPREVRAELDEHCRAAGIDVEAAEESRYLHRMVVCGAVPTPAGGGMAGRPGIHTGLDGVLVAGDWVGPVGHMSDAALVSGEAAGRAVARDLDRGQASHAIA